MHKFSHYFPFTIKTSIGEVTNNLIGEHGYGLVYSYSYLKI